jgi:ATP-binding cassette, subfamily B, bacterial
VIRFGFTGDPSVTRQKITPGTLRRIIPYARPYRWGLLILGLVTMVDAFITVIIPLSFRAIIDDGVLKHNVKVVAGVAIFVALLAVVDCLATLIQVWKSAQISQGITYDLRSQVFAHVQQQPVAFFTRAQTGSLVSRLNTDVVSTQQAITTLLSTVISSGLSIVLVLVVMFFLSWLVTVVALLTIPIVVFAARLIGRRLQRFARETMQRNAEMGSFMNERFNVAGAILVKLFGRPADEIALFSNRASRVRDIGVKTSVYGQGLLIVLTLLAALTTAMVYGAGGSLVIDGKFEIGTLVALAALLNRIYGPVTQLSNMQMNVMTALVGFDRIFELLDLKPLVTDRGGAVALAETSSPDPLAPDIQFDHVSFRYPVASEVSLASLESIARPETRRANGSAAVLRDVSFVALPGQLTALVGPSGAGKSTITYLVSRMYDPVSGSVRIGGHDLRDVSLASVHGTVGVVTQDAHLFHDSIRGNLVYARPGATEEELIEACRAAQIWSMISSLPDGLDTLVGDRGYRLSGGEKQRIALARLLLKSPSVVVLDEATAHLDSESEAAVQQALRSALAGRTSLVIAHRLSTIRKAHQILVVADGRLVQCGTHEQLLASGGLYERLYQTQFAGQAVSDAGGA